MHPVVTDMKKAEAILAWAVEKMEERYRLLAQTKVRHVTSFNELGEEEIRKRLGPKIAQMDEVPTHMPFIVIIADELADLMMTAGKDVEQHIIRLAQKSRAVGIHLILATQKPTVDVITGLIKSNLPARLAFQVASRMDSRVVLDEGGAEKLLGNGDMLFLWPGTSTVIRGQGTFLADDEIQSLVDQCSQVEQDFEHELVNLKVDQEHDLDPRTLRKRDELYESAIEVVLREGRGSCSLLQRALGIGYGRAARLVDYMAEDGIVGDHNGSSAREVLLTMEEWDALQNASEVMTDEEMEDAELMIEYDSAQIDEDFDEAEWGEAEDDDDLEWEEQEDEETVSISMQSSLTVNADDDAEDWADELDSEYNE
jgi:S-DNA-T family DNA segregation ATPase FtsK/SpoIIIE